MLPPSSIVIPCFNEEMRIGETLRLTLDYLAANTPESELIVVNDGSTDATGAVAREKLKSAQVATHLLREDQSGFFPTLISPRHLSRRRS
jgi:glycosyltransferase involved in cell wall biosynthesis